MSSRYILTFRQISPMPLPIAVRHKTQESNTAQCRKDGPLASFMSCLECYGRLIRNSMRSPQTGLMTSVVSSINSQSPIVCEGLFTKAAHACITSWCVPGTHSHSHDRQVPGQQIPRSLRPTRGSIHATRADSTFLIANAGWL